jgi:hypothetical protein
MLLALAAESCLVGCSEQPALAPALTAASSHFAAFERFERWALRSVSSDVRLHGDGALRETLFAPLRRDREVLWADVQWDSDQVLAYRKPLADAELKFVPIEAPRLGRVMVALCEPCEGAGEGRECVVIERVEKKKKRPARVRMAFCEAPVLGAEAGSVAKPPVAAKAAKMRAPAPKDRRLKTRGSEPRALAR